MCGIFGLIFHRPLKRNLTKQATKFFEVLALANIERGDDAAGCAVVSTSGSYTMFKYPKKITQVLRMVEWDSALGSVDKNTFMLLGHTRNGTHGSNNVDNAHPFVFPQESGKVLVGTHNGVIFNHESLHEGEPFENDSRNLFCRLSQEPISKYPDVLGKVDGTYAIAVATGGSAVLARDGSSPCFVAYIPELGATAYSSLAVALEWAKATANLDSGKPKKLPADRLCVFTRNNVKPVTTSIPTFQSPKPDSSKILPRETPGVTHGTTRTGVAYTVYTGQKASIHCGHCNRKSEEENLTVLAGRVCCTHCFNDATSKLPNYACTACGEESYILHPTKLVWYCPSCYRKTTDVAEKAHAQ